MPLTKGGVYALGNFDGVHLGHQAVVKVALEKARGMGVPARVLTFEPHPRSILKPHIPPFRLTPAPTKIRLLKKFGVDDVIVKPFTKEFSQLGAHDFVRQVLLEECGAQHVVAGFDFVFGHARGGSTASLRDWLAQHNVGVTEVAPFRDDKGDMMSSTRAREALQQGDLATAQHILGRDWAITGKIQRGQQKGQEIGVPTANIDLGEHLRPKYGVYIVRAGRVSNPAVCWHGVANIGVRPTVDGQTELLEFHLLDVFENLYGQEWYVELLHFIRPELTFPDIGALRAQIMKDIETTKRFVNYPQ